jgi:hypothetical protein
MIVFSSILNLYILVTCRSRIFCELNAVEEQLNGIGGGRSRPGRKPAQTILSLHTISDF